MRAGLYLWIICLVSCFGTHPAFAVVTLEQAWVQAYENNPSLEAARAKLRVTDEQVSQALSHWRPSIDATGNLGKTYQYLPSQQQFGTADFADTTRGYGVQVTQPIFRGFRTLSETESAEKQVLAGRAELQSVEQQLLLDSGTAFLDVLRDETILALTSDNVKVLQQKLDETRVRARVGDLTQTDVQQAESRLARAEVSRLQTENNLTAHRAAYLRLTGFEADDLRKPELRLDAPHDLSATLHLAADQNPAVRSTQYTVDAANAEIDLNKGSLLPELNLVGNTSRNYGQSSTLPGRFDSSQVLLQLTIPLYRSGADYSRVRAAQQTSTQRRMESEEARHKAVETAHNAWQAKRTAEAAIKADRLEVNAATKALEGVKVQSRVGTRTTLDVLNAEQELLDAKTDLARSEHDRDLAILQIKSAIGQLTADALVLPLETYSPDKNYQKVRSQWIGWSDSEGDIYRKESIQQVGTGQPVEAADHVENP